MKTLHAMRQALEGVRHRIETEPGNRLVDAASCEVVDELIRRIEVIIDRMPLGAPLTRSNVEHDMPAAVALLDRIATVLEQMGRLSREVGDIVYQQRQPFIGLIGRIESQGYSVDTTTFTTCIDEWDWSVDDTDSPDVRAQLETEKTARAEQAVRYQQRLQRMDAAINRIEDGYAQQIRGLIKPTLLG